METPKLKTIKDIVQDSNMNFLIGSGLSAPYLALLGNVEILLTEIEELDLLEDEKIFIRASLYKKYFDGVISKNVEILNDDTAAKHVLSNYQNLLIYLNRILLKRKSSILTKQINLFTTNIDIFLEKSMEARCLEYSDGFSGHLKPVFSLSNFKKSIFKKSLHFDITSELPVFNLIKFHGSVSWEMRNQDIIHYSHNLDLIRSIIEHSSKIDQVLEIEDSDTAQTLEIKGKGKKCDEPIYRFLENYDALPIVNPTKEKFKHTLLNQTYYEMLRIYSNELEKENTVLFVLGFSFADEHIKEITLRAANSNPTLMIYVIAYNLHAKVAIEKRLINGKNVNNNIIIIAPPKIKSMEGEGEQEQFQYDLQTINTQFISKLIE